MVSLVYWISPVHLSFIASVCWIFYIFCLIFGIRGFSGTESCIQLFVFFLRSDIQNFPVLLDIPFFIVSFFFEIGLFSPLWVEGWAPSSSSYKHLCLSDLRSDIPFFLKSDILIFPFCPLFLRSDFVSHISGVLWTHLCCFWALTLPRSEIRQWIFDRPSSVPNESIVVRSQIF